MTELELVKLWNQKRSQVISAQMGPTVMLGVVVIALAFGQLLDASDAVNYLVLAAIASTGLLATISQYAAIREAEAVVADLGKIADLSETGAMIKNSGMYLTLTKLVIVVLDVAVFVVIAMAVLGNQDSMRNVIISVGIYVTVLLTALYLITRGRSASKKISGRGGDFNQFLSLNVKAAKP